MEFEDLHNDVISKGLCTACGSCVGICPTKGMAMVYADHEPEPVLKGPCNGCGLCYEMCPGKDIPFPYMEEMAFGRRKEADKEPLGIYRACLAGYAVDDKLRYAGASGGIASALLLYALEERLIDRALVGEMASDVPWHTKPLAASNREDLLRAAKSKSQVVFTNAILGQAITRNAKVGLVGLGCHIHALRKLQLKYPSYRVSKGVSFSLGLFCLSNYYTIATELLILERTGIKSLDEVARVDYRVGKPRGNFRVASKDGQVYTIQGTEVHNFFGLFRRDRCTMCIDWCNELADISIGAYWGPAMESQDMNLGWSTIIVRTEIGEQLMKDAEAKGYLVTLPTDAKYLTFCGGFYQKKHNNVYNIIKRKRYNLPIPDFSRPPQIEPVKREITFNFSQALHLSYYNEKNRSPSK